MGFAGVSGSSTRCLRSGPRGRWSGGQDRPGGPVAVNLGQFSDDVGDDGGGGPAVDVDLHQLGLFAEPRDVLLSPVIDPALLASPTSSRSIFGPEWQSVPSSSADRRRLPLWNVLVGPDAFSAPAARRRFQSRCRRVPQWKATGMSGLARWGGIRY